MKNIGTCGENCGGCKYNLDGTCKGCIESQGNPFYSKKQCEMYACAYSKGFLHCCCCDIFPCDDMKKSLIGENGEEGAERCINNLRELHNTH